MRDSDGQGTARQCCCFVSGRITLNSAMLLQSYVTKNL
jgi:hypothetical protein